MGLFTPKKEKINPRRTDVNIHKLSLADDLPPALPLSLALPPQLYPLVSPAYENVRMCNILPSYQLYQSTFSQNLDPSLGDQPYDPPTYETSLPAQLPGELGAGPPPFGSAQGSAPGSTEGSLGSAAAPPDTDDYFSAAAVTTRWENSLLGNTHRLKKLQDYSAPTTAKLKISIFITDQPPVPGVAPSVLDTQLVEYSQGDSVHGFITVQNTCRDPFSFDMFSVMFEGRISVMGDSTDAKKPAVFYKFLNMFDYRASWTDADFSDGPDLATVDPRDNTRLRFPDTKVFLPDVVYKRFFSFTIPDKLLDCACEPHNSSYHVEVMPTIGLERDEFLSKIRQLRSNNPAARAAKPQPAEFSLHSLPTLPAPAGSAPSPPAQKPRKQGVDSIMKSRIKDLSFPDTAVSFGVVARVVGKMSDYQKHFPKSSNDEFIIINDSSSFIRVVPIERLAYSIDTAMLERELRLVHHNLVSRVKEKIALGNELLETVPSHELDQVLEGGRTRSDSVAKRKQLYLEPMMKPQAQIDPASDTYELIVPLKKKTLGAAPKIIGIISASTPKVDNYVKYIPPFKFKCFKQSPNSGLGTVVKIPLTLGFKFTHTAIAKTNKPPEIRSVSAEIVVATFRSRKYPIPIDIMNDLKFTNRSMENDNLETHLVHPFKKYVEEITRLTHQLGFEVLNIDNQFIMDIKCLANLAVKYNSFKIEKVQSKHTPAGPHWTSPTDDLGMFTKQIDVEVDIKNTLVKEASHEDLTAETFTLVPSFQSCIIGRYYFVKVNIKLQSNEVVCIKVPVNIFK